jgi:hypothetical protein
VLPTVFTGGNSSGRSPSNVGVTARDVRDQVPNDHAGSITNDVAATGADPAPAEASMVGAVATASSTAIAAALVPAAANTVTLSAGAVAGRDGRAVFDGSGGILLAMNLSGALSWDASAGVGPRVPLPSGSTRTPLRGGPARWTISAANLPAGIGAQSPRRSDLLTDFKPYDRGSLEQAIDRFLARFDDFAGELSGSEGSTGLLTEIMAVAVALTAAKVGLRLFCRPGDDEDEVALTDPEVFANLEPFPGALDL